MAWSNLFGHGPRGQSAPNEFETATRRVKGLAGEDQFERNVKASGWRVLGRQVTVEAGGRRAILDFVIESPDGRIRYIIEVKTGPTAKPSTPQRIVIRGNSETGRVTPWGPNALDAGLEHGILTEIRIIVVYQDRY